MKTRTIDRDLQEWRLTEHRADRARADADGILDLCFVCVALGAVLCALVLSL